jgi:RNA polymerase sigma-70 factor, ECF subfamily
MRHVPPLQSPDQVEFDVIGAELWNGLPEVGDALRGGMNALGQWRALPVMANGQPGAAGYLRRPGQTAFFPFVLTVLRFEHGRVADIAAFEQPSMFTAFGLPASL